MKAALVVIFNHKYNKNIPKLQKIYGQRFSNIIYLVPFFCEKDLNDYNIVPVFESSYTFQGYIAQAKKELKKLDVAHYLFIGDDVILNPQINENNYWNYMGVNEEKSFITEMKSITEPLGRYIWDEERVYDIISKFGSERFVNYKNEIPSAQEAFLIAEKYGVKNVIFNRKIYKNSKSLKSKLKIKLLEINLDKITLNYPIMAGYSDVIAIAKNDFVEFSRICGVFAAMGVFVEAAIPTAMMLSCKKIVDCDSLDYQRGDMWGLDTKQKFFENYKGSYKLLIEKWDPKLLFVHPIKLSQWRM